MARLKRLVRIRAPIEAVWDYITDPRTAREWSPNLVGLRELPEGEIGAGATWVQVARLAGRQMQMRCMIVEYDRPHRGSVRATGDVDFTLTTALQERDGLTEITQTLDYQVPGGLLGALANRVFLEQAAAQDMERTLLNQKRILEARHAPPPEAAN